MIFGAPKENGFYGWWIYTKEFGRGGGYLHPDLVVRKSTEFQRNTRYGYYLTKELAEQAVLDYNYKHSQVTINTDGLCQLNWRVVRDRVIKGLKYSYDVNNVYSLDTNMRNMATTKGTLITADALVECIGELAIKRMIENIWRPECYRLNLSVDTESVVHILRGFYWHETSEGIKYWEDISNKLTEYDPRR